MTSPLQVDATRSMECVNMAAIADWNIINEFIRRFKFLTDHRMRLETQNSALIAALNADRDRLAQCTHWISTHDHTAMDKKFTEFRAAITAEQERSKQQQQQLDRMRDGYREDSITLEALNNKLRETETKLDQKSAEWYTEYMHAQDLEAKLKHMHRDGIQPSGESGSVQSSNASRRKTHLADGSLSSPPTPDSPPKSDATIDMLIDDDSDSSAV